MNGLQNFGNSCYLNTALQLLLTLPKALQPTDAPLWMDLRLIHRFICNHPSFQRGVPGDLYEALTVLLDHFHETAAKAGVLLPSMSVNKQFLEASWVSYESLRPLRGLARLHRSQVFDTIVGQLKWITECPCGNESSRFETFKVLEVEVPRDGKTTLTDCLNQLLEPQTMDKDNLYDCDKCRKSTLATRYCSIEYYPKVLFIAFKRFTYTATRSGSFIPVKLNTAIDIPETLRTKVTDIKYTLNAMGHHMGGAQGGHCYATTASGYLLNDTIVKKLQRTNQYKNATTPYVVCYIR